MSDDMMEGLEDMIRNHVEQMWKVTEEVSGSGRLFTRAVCKIAPVEIIHLPSGGMVELTMN
jgi:hypothetical protein